MSSIFIVENGVIVGINGGNVVVTQNGKEIRKIPKDTVDGILFFSQSQMTTQCMKFCLDMGIRVSFFDQNGRFHGYLMSTYSTSAKRLRKQVSLSENQTYSLEISRKIVTAKIHNQIVMLRRISNKENVVIKDDLFHMLNAKKKVLGAKSIPQIMGYEGYASRCYFDTISEVFGPEWKFNGRNKRPPQDPVNSLLSFGYSLLTQEMHGEIENRGLTGYVGFLHEDTEKHPSLSSDLIEEWRPVIVDSVVIMALRKGMFSKDDFQYSQGGCFLTNTSRKKFLKMLEDRMNEKTKYLGYIDKSITFRQGLWHQAEKMALSIEACDSSIYEPVQIR